MKNLSCFVFLCLLQTFPRAQDYLTGKITDNRSADRQIFYDRTQIIPSKGIYHTLYKVFDEHKLLLYSITAIHERQKASLTVVIKSDGVASINNTLKYERNKSGLILTNQGNLDTVFSDLKAYTYILSFADTVRDYPIVHQLRTNSGAEVTLDPITKLRLRKQKELVKHLVANDPELKKLAVEKQAEAKHEADLFEAYLLRLRDSLYYRNAGLADEVNKYRTKIDDDIALLFRTRKVYPDARRYEGEKRNGRAEGNGLFMANNSYYDGLFTDGKFVSGIVNIHYDAYEYCGQYSSDSLNGTGWLKYKNASYLLGTFKEGRLVDGVTLDISKNGDVYFGVVEYNQRSGYAELYNAKGEMYCGEFRNGVLIKGYSKDSDPFGFYTYSRIENGKKTPVDVKRGEAFFNPLIQAKP